MPSSCSLGPCAKAFDAATELGAWGIGLFWWPACTSLGLWLDGIRGSSFWRWDLRVHLPPLGPSSVATSRFRSLLCLLLLLTLALSSYLIAFCNIHGSWANQTRAVLCLHLVFVLLFWDGLGRQSESSGIVSSSGVGLSLQSPGQQHHVDPRHSPWLNREHRCCSWGSAFCLRTWTLMAFTLLLLFQTQFSDKPVQDRGLVVTDLRAEDVVLEHRSYCSAKARERHFPGDVLGYVTPVSWALGWTGRSQGQSNHWGLCSHLLGPHCGGAAGEMPPREAARIMLGVLWGLAPCGAAARGSPVLHPLPVE